LLPPAEAYSQPVSCSTMLWHGETLTLVLKRLDATNGKVDIGFEMLNRRSGDAETNARWTFKDGILDYLNPTRIQYHLVLGPTEMKGSYINWNAPRLSDPNLTFKCDGPVERVIVR
jgi:hypothetical protein